MKIKTFNSFTIIYPEKCATREDIEYLKILLLQLIENGYSKIFINFSNLKCLSLIGFSRLIEILRKYSQDYIRISLICGQKKVYSLIKKFGLKDSISIYKKEEEVIKNDEAHSSFSR